MNKPIAIPLTAGKDRQAWLDERRRGLGGSEVAAILGLNPWKTALDVYNDKLGLGAGDSEPPSQAAHFGNQLEDVVAQEFASRTGLKVQRINSILCTSERPWMRANIDRAIVNPDIAKRVFVLKDVADDGRILSTDTILECKTAGEYQKDKWGPSQEAEILSDRVVSEHEIPPYYETQVQWYMGVTGAKAAYLAALIGGRDFRIYYVERNDVLIEAMIDRCESFWNDNVLAHQPPAAVNSEDVQKLFAKDDGELVEATNEQAADVSEFTRLSALISEYEQQRKAVKERLILAIGEHTGLTIGGEKAVTYKAQRTKRFQSTAFKKAQPDLYAKYTKESTYRVFRA